MIFFIQALNTFLFMLKIQLSKLRETILIFRWFFSVNHDNLKANYLKINNQ